MLQLALEYWVITMAVLNSVRPTNFFRSFKNKASQFALDCLGGRNRTFTVSSDKAVDTYTWIGKNLSSAENRLILGASALMSQPFIDAANKDVDDETRRYSVCRTIAKIIAGTLTGYSIRKLCIKSIDAFTKLPTEITPDMRFKKLRSCLLPTIKATAEELAQYKNALGTLMALGVMMFTNFLIDAPLTKWLTNVFTGNTKPKEGVENAQSR